MNQPYPDPNRAGSSGQCLSKDSQPVPAHDRLEPVALVAALAERFDEIGVLVRGGEALEPRPALPSSRTPWGRSTETTWSTKSAPSPTCSMPITATAWS